MSDATPVKRGLTLAWSIGLGLLLLGITTALLLPATKSARIRFDETQHDSPEGESTSIDADGDAEDADGDAEGADGGAKDADTEDRPTPEPSP